MMAELAADAWAVVGVPCWFLQQQTHPEVAPTNTPTNKGGGGKKLLSTLRRSSDLFLVLLVLLLPGPPGGGGGGPVGTNLRFLLSLCPLF